MGNGNWLRLLLACLVAACASDGTSPVRMAHKTLGSRCDAYQPEPDPEVTPWRRLQGRNPAAPRDGSKAGVACAEVTIDIEGSVVDPQIVYTTHRVFARRFLEALRQWRYEPATRDGEPTEVRIVLSATFTIE